MSNDNVKQLRARLRYYKEPQLTEEEARLVIGAIPLQALPGQPAREGDGEWEYVEDRYGRPCIRIGKVELRPHWEGLRTADEIRQVLRRAVTDHARAALVPELVEMLQQISNTLNGLRDSPNHPLPDSVRTFVRFTQDGIDKALRIARLTEALAALVNADAGGETTPDFERAIVNARIVLAAVARERAL